jgi:dihydroxyacid dehydratase/phosphogluconate dehydratase
MDARTFDKSKLPSRHGVPQVMRALLDGEQNRANVKLDTNQKVASPVSNPISATGGVVGLRGSLAPDGALGKVAGMHKLQSRGRKAWKAPPNSYQSGVLRKYADQVGPARKGAVTHAGGAKEVICYADI